MQTVNWNINERWCPILADANKKCSDIKQINSIQLITEWHEIGSRHYPLLWPMDEEALIWCRSVIKGMKDQGCHSSRHRPSRWYSAENRQHS